MSVHAQVAEVTNDMETAIYEALDSIDRYAATIQRLVGEQHGAAEPNEMLVKRLQQFLAKAATMTTTVEDDVVTELLFCVDRLFAVDLAEKGTFI